MDKIVTQIFRFPVHRIGMLLTFATTLLWVAACQPGAVTQTPEGRSSIYDENLARQASVAWDEAHNAGDVDQLMRLYTESAISMPPNREALEGRSTIEADFREFFSNFEVYHKTTILSLKISGDWAIERGHYEFAATPKDKTEGFEESGKHIVIRKKIQDNWLVEWEIWNSDDPSEG